MKRLAAPSCGSRKM